MTHHDAGESFGLSTAHRHHHMALTPPHFPSFFYSLLTNTSLAEIPAAFLSLRYEVETVPLIEFGSVSVGMVEVCVVITLTIIWHIHNNYFTPIINEYS